MSEIDRIAEKLHKRYLLNSYPSLRLEDVRAALLEYGAIVREECAKKCETIEMQQYDSFKRGENPYRGNPFYEGASEGAAECAFVIRNANKG